MQAPTDNLRGEVADLAAQVERLKAEVDAAKYAANRIRPTGKVYTIQGANPLREFDQASVTLAQLARVVAALLQDSAEARVIGKA